MTQAAKNSLKLTIGAAVLIFGMGVAWRELRGDIDDKVSTERFMTDSVSRDGTTTIILQALSDNNRELRQLNDRMLQVCIKLAGKAGCR